MTSDAQINRAIDKLHLKSTKKLVPHLKKQFADVNEERVERVVQTRPKDVYPRKKENYYYPVFSNHPYSFQMDLLEQSHDREADKYPAFFLIIINVNTKFAYAFPTESKNQDTIFNLIKDFVSKHRVISFTCDEEGAFQSNKVLNYLTERKISVKLINEQRHSALSVIDKFIETLRDMNTPGVHSKHQSDDPKYRDFTSARMEKLLKIQGGQGSHSIG